jgi:hypothetical protein
MLSFRNTPRGINIDQVYGEYDEILTYTINQRIQQIIARAGIAIHPGIQQW